MDISVENLSVNFPTKLGDVKAVNRANVKFEMGKVTGIIGETGSGKSVLGLSILGLVQGRGEIQGKIFLGKEELRQKSDKCMSKIRGRDIAFITQNPGTSLNPSMKIGKQIEEVYKIQNIKGNKKQKVIDLLASLCFTNPEEIYNSYPFELSGGMRQRVLIAIAVAGNPKWIIADEPTKGLDAIIRGQVYKTLNEARERGASFILITHDLVLTKKICDKVVVMYCGNIIEIGNCDKIFSNPKHPYTRGLIESLPQNGMKVMEGFAPAFTKLPQGCPFEPRCRNATEVCKYQRPELLQVKGGMVSCHEYTK